MFGAAVPCFEAKERLLKVALCIVCIGPGGCMVYAVCCCRYCCSRVAR